ncbi:tetratricopeptide repeat protein [Blastococcus montanus]|uniref:tetratricopeptide repeat protein n=1 Tax=Blastococcus montanus TaxID=3144973 RepID=UPI0032093C78
MADCAVRINTAEDFAGSGVLVAPGQVLTCAHVLAAAAQEGAAISVVYGGRTWAAQLRAMQPAPPTGGTLPSPYGWPDLAWLDVPGLTDHPWAELDTATPGRGEELVGYGFSEAFQAGVPAGQWGSYRVDGPVDTGVGQRWQLSAAQAAPGMSGTGLINPATGRLFGLLTRTRDADTDAGGWAVHAHPALTALPGFNDLLDLARPHPSAWKARRQAWEENAEDWLAAAGLRDLLTAPYEPLPDRRTPATLLLPRHGVVPFHPARRPDLDDLLTWCTNPAAPQVRLLTGPAGTGKTRLAAELAQRAADAGWLTGFLAPSDDPAAVCDRLARRADSLLLVVDYAETQTDLPDLLAAVAALDEDVAGVRVLLLARAAGDWWRDLPASGDDPHRTAQALVGARPFALSQLDELVSDPTPAYQDAAAALAKRQNLTSPAKLPLLATAETWSYLSAHLAALDAVGTPDEPGRPNPDGRPRSPADVLDHVLTRERRHWRRTATIDHLAPVDDTILSRTVAALTLLGAGTETDASTTLARVPDLAGAEGHRRALARWMRRHYPPDRSDDWLRGLQPDLLAESHITTVLAADPDVASSLLGGLPEPQARRALTVLTRAARYQPAAHQLLCTALRSDLANLGRPAITVAGETGSPLDRVLTDTLAEPDLAVEPDLLMRLAAALPEHTIALREAAMVLTARRVQHLRRSGPQDELAGWLNNLSIRLDHVGRREDALTAIEEASGLYRALAAARPDAFTPALATALNNLSNRLAGLGRREDALTAVEEAVALHRALAAARPDAFTPDLAMSLNSLSLWLAGLGRREDALAAVEEASGLYRTLAADRPDAFTPDLATSLTNASNRLADLGRREDALAAIEEASGLYRTLAADRPDAFTPHLATSLNNASLRLAGLGRREDALTAIEEASGLYRTLAADRPDAFTPDLAMSLNNLSNRLAGLGRREDALTAIEEAVGLRRTLAAARPNAFTPDLATSLNNASNRLADLGRREDALTAIEEASGLYRTLAAARPDAFTPDLAMSLNNLSNQLGSLGRREDALAAIEEAVTLRRTLAAHRPDAYIPDLAMSLNNLSIRLAGLGRREDALAAIEEAVTLRRTLAAHRPDAFTPDLAMSLNNASNRLAGLGRREDALAAIEEASGLYRTLAAARPDAFTPDLAMSLNSLSIRLAGLGRREDALTAIEEAAGLYRALAAARPDAFTPDLAMSLNSLSIRLGDLGRREDALAAIEEAVGLYRALAAARPDAFTPDLAMSLNNASTALGDLGRPQDALAAIEEASGLYRTLAAARPDTFTPHLAGSLNNLSLWLFDLGRPEDALTAIDEATGLYRTLAATRPDAFTPDLATSLNNQSNQLGSLGRREDALTAIEEAAGLYRALYNCHPDLYRHALVKALANLATAQRTLGSEAEAAHVERERAALEDGAPKRAE